MWAWAVASPVGVVKRAHKMLTIDQKLELLNQIGNKSYTVLCKEYGIGRSTISGIKKRNAYSKYQLLLSPTYNFWKSKI